MTGLVSVTRPHDAPGVAVVRRDHPPVNALTLAMTRELHASLTAIAADDSVRAVVMTAAGDRSFGAGSDIGEFAELIAAGDVVERKMGFENETFSLLAALPQPTIAAVHGATLGGGLEIALACDLLVADARAVVGLPEVKLGLLPGSGAPARCAARIGMGRTKQLMFFGDPVPATVALEWGLVDAVAEHGTAEAAALDWARELATRSVSGLRACKDAAHGAYRVAALEEEVRRTLELSRAAFAHPDADEGAAAFLGRRHPRWPSHRVGADG